MAGAQTLDTAEQIRALAHPARRRILDALREPDSAAGVARRLAEPRQRINHHVGELAKAGLIRKTGERRKGNFVEQVYEATASTFVPSPRLTWGDDDRRRQAMADQVALDNLVRFGEAVSADAAVLLDRAAFDGDDVASAAVQATVTLPDAEARAAFLDEYLSLVQDLVERHAAADGPTYTVGLVAYPTIREGR